MKPEFKFGIYGGIAMCAFKIVEFLPVFQKTRIESGIDTGLLAIVIVAAFVMWGIKVERSNSSTLSITFIHAFVIGAIITLIITAMTLPPIYIYAKLIHPREASQMIDYIKVNRVEDVLSDELIQEYYSPAHRTKLTGRILLLTGFIASFLSAVMFRRRPTTEEDYEKEIVLQSKLKSFFAFTIIFSQLPVFVYVAWFLKWIGISTFLFEMLTDPLVDPLTGRQDVAFSLLQEGTSVIALTAIILNVICYNKINEFRHGINIWNLRMILINGVLFLFSLWPVIHSLF